MAEGFSPADRERFLTDAADGCDVPAPGFPVIVRSEATRQSPTPGAGHCLATRMTASSGRPLLHPIALPVSALPAWTVSARNGTGKRMQDVALAGQFDL